MNSNFLVAINKPTGLTSSDVVIKVRKILSLYYNEKVKTGHMGTLDPGASGVLLIGVNKANRLFDLLLNKNKTYVGRLTFGKSTDSQDSFGKVISVSDKKPTIDEIQNVLDKFRGKISQIPPKYSALKINGQKGYDLARQNKDFEFSARNVFIFDLKILRYEEINGHVKTVDFFINCSSGTYIRTLLYDIAKALDCEGYMSYLIRDSIMDITLNDCVTIDEFSLNPVKNIINIEDLIKKFMNVIEVSEKQYTLISNGVGIKLSYKDKNLAVIREGKIDFILENKNGIYKSIINLQ